MAPKKSPSKLDISNAPPDYAARKKWLEEEYAFLANKRNTYCFLYNQAKKARQDDELDSEHMKEWRKKAWEHEIVMRWIAERYQSGAVVASGQMGMDV